MLSIAPPHREEFSLSVESLIVNVIFVALRIPAPLYFEGFLPNRGSSCLDTKLFCIAPPHRDVFWASVESSIVNVPLLYIAPPYCEVFPASMESIMANSPLLLSIAPPSFWEVFSTSVESVMVNLPLLYIDPPHFEVFSASVELIIVNSLLFSIAPPLSWYPPINVMFLIIIFLPVQWNIRVKPCASIACPFPSIIKSSTSNLIPSKYSDSSFLSKTISESRTISLTPLWIKSSRYLKFLILSFGIGLSVTSSFAGVSTESLDLISSLSLKFSLSFSMLSVNVGSSIISLFALF